MHFYFLGKSCSGASWVICSSFNSFFAKVFVDKLPYFPNDFIFQEELPSINKVGAPVSPTVSFLSGKMKLKKTERNKVVECAGVMGGVMRDTFEGHCRLPNHINTVLSDGELPVIKPNNAVNLKIVGPCKHKSASKTQDDYVPDDINQDRASSYLPQTSTNSKAFPDLFRTNVATNKVDHNFEKKDISTFVSNCVSEQKQLSQLVNSENNGAAAIHSDESHAGCSTAGSNIEAKQDSSFHAISSRFVVLS